MTSTLLILGVANEVSRELERSTHLHGPMRGVHEGASVIREEFDELWDEIKINPTKDHDCLRRRRKEAIQLAAMAMKFVIDVCDNPVASTGGGVGYDAKVRHDTDLAAHISGIKANY
jgi:hypothetical protein